MFRSTADEAKHIARCMAAPTLVVAAPPPRPAFRMAPEHSDRVDPRRYIGSDIPLSIERALREAINAQRPFTFY